jgi:hypothetical protein
MTFFVYGLYDSCNWSECRYVGAASHLHRPLEHGGKDPYYIDRLVRKIVSEGRHLGWKILECCDSWQDTLAMEKWLILSYKVSGHRLTNLTEGGDGCILTSKEILVERNKKIKQAHNTPKLRALRSLISTKANASPEVRVQKRLTALRACARPETKLRMIQASRELGSRPEIRAARKAAMTPQRIKQFVETNQKAHTPELIARRNQSIRAAWQRRKSFGRSLS